MKITEYKGYDIEFLEHMGQFNINGVKGFYDKYKQATDAIDRIVRAESKKGLPIKAIKQQDMSLGTITSYNSVTGEVWFTHDASETSDRLRNIKAGQKGKYSLFTWKGEPAFYAINHQNTMDVNRYNGLSARIREMNNEQNMLMNRLTEPITFKNTEEEED